MRGVKVLKSFGPELNSLADGLVMAAVDMKARAIKKLENEYGFTREEAIFLVMDEWYAIARQARTNNKGGK